MDQAELISVLEMVFGQNPYYDEAEHAFELNQLTDLQKTAVYNLEDAQEKAMGFEGLNSLVQAQKARDPVPTHIDISSAAYDFYELVPGMIAAAPLDKFFLDQLGPDLSAGLFEGYSREQVYAAIGELGNNSDTHYPLAYLELVLGTLSDSNAQALKTYEAEVTKFGRKVEDKKATAQDWPGQQKMYEAASSRLESFLKETSSGKITLDKRSHSMHVGRQSFPYPLPLLSFGGDQEPETIADAVEAYAKTNADALGLDYTRQTKLVTGKSVLLYVPHKPEGTDCEHYIEIGVAHDQVLKPSGNPVVMGMAFQWPGKGDWSSGIDPLGLYVQLLSGYLLSQAGGK